MADAIRERWAAGRRRVLGCLPTGGGKTEVAIELIRAEATPTNRVLVLVERKVLCHQWAARMRRHGMDDVGILQAENTARTWAPALVGMVQTIKARGIPEGVGFVVVDESHIWHQTHDKVLDAAVDARVLGLTATPLRQGLGLRFDDMVIGSTIRELIGLGHLVQPRYFAPAHATIAAALDSVHIRGGDFAADELSIAMRHKAIVGDVVGEWKARAANRQTVAFCVDKEHARVLSAEFCAAGFAAEVVVDDTDDEDRERIFAAFDRCEVRVLCSVGVLAVGFDSPIASCAILARPTLSTSLHIQQGGRVLRPFAGKTDALVLDHAMNTLRHGRLEDFEPPADLSMIDKGTDKKKRDVELTQWVCKHCNAMNELHHDICQECGEPRRRQTAVVLLDGALQEIEVRPGAPLPGPTPQDIETFYRMAAWQGRQYKHKPGVAFFKTCSRFKLDPNAEGRRLIPLAWRSLEPIPPDDDAARWFRADYQRYLVAKRAREAA
jgi:superfamily II DNA or RNA helicase